MSDRFQKMKFRICKMRIYAKITCLKITIVLKYWYKCESVNIIHFNEFLCYSTSCLTGWQEREKQEEKRDVAINEPGSKTGDFRLHSHNKLNHQLLMIKSFRRVQIKLSEKAQNLISPANGVAFLLLVIPWGFYPPAQEYHSAWNIDDSKRTAKVESRNHPACGVEKNNCVILSWDSPPSNWLWGFV